MFRVSPLNALGMCDTKRDKVVVHLGEERTKYHQLRQPTHPRYQMETENVEMSQYYANGTFAQSAEYVKGVDFGPGLEVDANRLGEQAVLWKKGSLLDVFPGS